MAYPSTFYDNHSKAYIYTHGSTHTCFSNQLQNMLWVTKLWSAKNILFMMRVLGNITPPLQSCNLHEIWCNMSPISTQKVQPLKTLLHSFHKCAMCVWRGRERLPGLSRTLCVCGLRELVHEHTPDKTVESAGISGLDPVYRCRLSSYLMICVCIYADMCYLSK